MKINIPRIRIILNEFIPEFLLRRGFAEISVSDLHIRQMVQLTKAQALLNTVKKQYKDFRDHFGVTAKNASTITA